jgi:hypothetical protein
MEIVQAMVRIQCSELVLWTGVEASSALDARCLLEGHVVLVVY